MKNFSRFFSDFASHYKYAFYSARAKLKAEVAGSYLNWVWWILQPFCMMIVYAVVFGVVFSAREDYFTAFIFIGISVWDFFNRCIKQSVKIVKNNKAIVTKVYIPKFVLCLTQMFVNAFKMLICFGIVAGLMIFYGIHDDLTLTINVLYVIPLLVDLFIFTFGCMCILTHFGVFIEDLSNVIDIILRFVFYFSGVMYSISHRIGDKYPVYATILEKCNPVAYVMASLRECALYGDVPGRKLMIAWFCISVLISMIGVHIIYKNENSYAKLI